MKTNELMIGDWVYYNETPIVVEQISKKKIGFHYKPSKYKMHHYAKYFDLTPILVTSNFLIKNNFNKTINSTNNIEYTLKYDKCEYIINNCSQIKDNPWYIYVINKTYQTIGQFSFKYVHELQHILKSCGIGEKIIIV